MDSLCSPEPDFALNDFMRQVEQCTDPILLTNFRRIASQYPSLSWRFAEAFVLWRSGDSFAFKSYLDSLPVHFHEYSQYCRVNGPMDW